MELYVPGDVSIFRGDYVETTAAEQAAPPRLDVESNDAMDVDERPQHVVAAPPPPPPPPPPRAVIVERRVSGFTPDEE